MTDLMTLTDSIALTDPVTSDRPDLCVTANLSLTSDLWNQMWCSERSIALCMKPMNPSWDWPTYKQPIISQLNGSITTSHRHSIFYLKR